MGIISPEQPFVKISQLFGLLSSCFEQRQDFST
jgi:hypothetical protein